MESVFRPVDDDAMKPVDYDRVAAVFDERYARNQYEGTQNALLEFLGAERPAVLEVGCGTGHWLALIAPRVDIAVGVDLSLNMLERARQAAPGALPVRATAERIPFAARSFDRVFAINALHHFRQPAAFVADCRRVLREKGSVMTIGLDPHTGLDQWWVYDYFPAALDADRRRYLPTAHIRSMFLAAGFVDAWTSVAQHLPAERSFDLAETQGLLDRRSTSQLLVIGDDDYEAGMRRIRAERPTLRADLLLYATLACVDRIRSA
jgi:ubiquinone/menaquinone biosynthesis C-methylase UbiE